MKYDYKYIWDIIVGKYDRKTSQYYLCFSQNSLCKKLLIMFIECKLRGLKTEYVCVLNTFEELC